MGLARRWMSLGVVTAIAAGAWSWDGLAQDGVTDSLPASAVIGGFTSDGFLSRGGVVGPWWTGSGTGGASPAPGGGFWFGAPGLGFGGSQGSSIAMNTFAPSATTTSGGAGMMSSSRLVPFVTAVVPVVGTGYSVTPVTTSAMLPAPQMIPPVITYRSAAVVTPSPPRPLASGLVQPSTPGARDRAKRLIHAGDTRLLDGDAPPAAAKAALAEYRSAMRFVQDDASIEIRQAMIYEALGERRDADRALDRATRIDARLCRSINTAAATAGGFLAPPPPGTPVAASRGFAILLDIAASRPSGSDSSVSNATLDWLTAAWTARWGDACDR